MQAAKVKITYNSNPDLLFQVNKQATGIFYKLYNNLELIEDKNFIKDLIKQNDLIDISIIESIIKEVWTKVKQHETEKNKKLDEIENFEKILANTNVKIISKKQRYSYKNKLAKLKRNFEKDSCFGSKALLRSITKHIQLAKNIGGKLTPEEVQKNKELYERELAEFRGNRNLGVYVIGRACEGGNRKVDFDLNNNKIIFKLNKNNHIELHYEDKRNELFDKLQVLINANAIPITIRITNTHIHFMYDNEHLNGFSFDDVEYKRTIKRNEITTKEGKKEIAIQFHQERESRMLVGKIKNRYASVDLNPKEISLVIGHKLSDDPKGDFKILLKQVFKLDKLTEKNSLASDDPKQKKLNNKRKNELHIIWKQIFTICNHYKVYNFVSEELNIKSPGKGEKNKEFNRQVNNIWHRTLTQKSIIKWTQNLGMKHIEVNPCYSSFIGNMVHNDYDPVCAGIEILRRGIVKYLKGSSLYPELGSINEQKMSYLAHENVQFNNFPTWISLYKHITFAGLRYRNREVVNSNFRSDNYLNSWKSKVDILHYS